jgi:hypothetical protein
MHSSEMFGPASPLPVFPRFRRRLHSAVRVLGGPTVFLLDQKVTIKERVIAIFLPVARLWIYFQTPNMKFTAALILSPFLGYVLGHAKVTVPTPRAVSTLVLLVSRTPLTMRSSVPQPALPVVLPCTPS